jgi:hypothetical protein
MNRSIVPGLRLLALGALLLLSGCQLRRSSPHAEGVQFGDPYEIVTNRSPAGPDIPPHLAGDTLIAHVAYPGGCRTHGFDLAHRTRRDTSYLRLVHQARADSCELYIHDEVRILLPEHIRRSRTIVLEDPEGGPPHILRWG